MAAHDPKLSLSDAEEQSFGASIAKTHRDPGHTQSLAGRQIARRLWDIATLALAVYLIFRWIQMHDGAILVVDLGAGTSNACHNSADIAEPEFDWYALKPSEDIKWSSCFGGHKCARLILPLDHSMPEGPKTHIALQMLPATDRVNYKGTVLVNPGGPGGSGTQAVRRFGQNISTVLGPEFDILGFDPRGTGATTPRAQCFASDAQFNIWNQGVRHINLTDDSVPLTRSRENLVGQRCLDALGGTGKEELDGTAEEWGPGRFMGTPDVATDMLRIVEKLGQEKLQYWGFSYGTVLGQYFAAMYPDKVGRLVIDGVYDANEYRARLWQTNLEDTDAVISSIFEFCHQAGPSKCPLYAPTVAEIQERVDTILDTLSQAPIPLPYRSGGPMVLTRNKFQEFMFLSAYTPLAWFKLVAEGLIAIETRNLTTLTIIAETIDPGVECGCKETLPWLATSEALPAIACGDGDVVSDEPGDYDAYFMNLTAQSSFASPMWGINRLMCSQWRIRPKSRFTGPLGGNTSHPLLILSPSFDPVCPLKDAKAVHERYAGSGLLVQNSYGHCSISSASLCTAKHLRAYFTKGTLPAEGTVCEVEELPFVGRVGDMLSAKDAELLEALRGLANGVPRFGLS